MAGMERIREMNKTVEAVYTGPSICPLEENRNGSLRVDDERYVMGFLLVGLALAHRNSLLRCLVGSMMRKRLFHKLNTNILLHIVASAKGHDS